jgi:uncharacterized protein YlxW (UPF0749 family)
MPADGSPEFAELVARLEELEEEERLVSAERRRLHDRLNAFHNEAAAERERELSVRRKELHREIDALRIEVGRTPGPTRKPGERGHQGSFWSRDG